MRLLKVCFMALVCVCTLTGCGTVFRGSTETYHITSDPVDALAVFSTGEVCTTPCTVEKKRNEPFSIRVEREGYQPFYLQVEEKTCEEAASTRLGNLVMFGSVLWLSIDSLTGADKELTPNPSQVSLIPLES